MREDLLARVLARASDPTTIHDYTRIWRDARIYPPATLEQIAATEAEIGFTLPQLLKQILMMIGNGGFGPGYGLIGVEGGNKDFKGEHLADLAGSLALSTDEFFPFAIGVAECIPVWTAPNPKRPCPFSTLRHTAFLTTI